MADQDWIKYTVWWQVYPLASLARKNRRCQRGADLSIGSATSSAGWITPSNWAPQGLRWGPFFPPKRTVTTPSTTSPSTRGWAITAFRRAGVGGA